MCRIWKIAVIGMLAAGSALAETASAPLPAVKDVLDHAVARAAQEQKNDQQFDAQYSFQKSKVMYYRNGQGELKDTRAKSSTHSPAVSANADVPVTPESKDKEPQAFDTHGKVNPKDFDKKNLMANPDMLERFDFTVVGRETVDGRPALVLDFQPKAKGLPERNLTDRFINKTAGRVWIDEADYVVAKADLHLTERVDILQGVVGAVVKFTFRFDRDRTDDGLWYVRNSRWHLEGREVVLNRIIDCQESRSAVRRVVPVAQR